MCVVWKLIARFAFASICTSTCSRCTEYHNICSDSVIVQHLIEVTSGHIKHALLEAADVVKKEGQQVSKPRTLCNSRVIYYRARSCNRLLTICSKFRPLLRTLKNIWTHCFWPWLNGRSKAVGRMRAARHLLQEHR